MSSIRDKVKGVVKKLSLWVLGIYAVLAVIDTWLLPSIYDSCDEYTQRLKGKEVAYQNKKYKVVICGTGPDRLGYDKVRMQVLSLSGTVLAQRKFQVFWESHSGDLEYHPDHITYYDDSDWKNSERLISMPPTAIDWIRARTPLLD